jgi:hypothetical protein
VLNVAFLDDLMALCDRPHQCRRNPRHLLEALLAEALAPDDERELEAAE